jgi:hypothetical protein
MNARRIASAISLARATEQRGVWSARVAAIVAFTLLATFSNRLPAAEPELGDLQATQSEVVARLGAAQTDNVSARLRTLHAGQTLCDRFEIGANIRWERSPGGSNAPTPSQAPPKFADAFNRKRCDGAFALWARGDLDFGFLRPSAALDRSELRTPGATIGADVRVLDGAVVGAAFGYGLQGMPLDVAGSESRARTQSLMLHGTFAPVRFIDIDALIGTGALELDAGRMQANGLDIAFADRSGSQGFGSLAVSANLAGTRVRLAPYARYDQVRSRLDAFADRDAGTAMTYGAACAAEDALTLGVRASFRLLFTAMMVEPALSIEQRRLRSAGDYESTLADPMTGFGPRPAADSDESLGASLRVPLRFGHRTSVALEYRYNSNSDSTRTESLRALLQTPF